MFAGGRQPPLGAIPEACPRAAIRAMAPVLGQTKPNEVFDTGTGSAIAGSEKVIAPLNRMGGIRNQS